MRFNPKARLDSNRIQDRGAGGGGGMGGGLGGGGLGGGGGGGMPMPGGKGGIGSIILLIILAIAGVSTNGFGLAGGGGGEPTDRYDQCQSGEDANKNADCARVAVLQSLDSFWDKTLTDQTDTKWSRPEAQTFADSTTTGCGQGSAAMGPFYCPADNTIYEDTDFYKAVLEQQLGGNAEGFVEPYVIGHEYGHHIQNIRGIMGKGGYSQTGPKSDAVRTELQADCYAGMWARGATGTDDGSGTQLIEGITEQDILEALDAAKTVGDDYIQERSGGRVNDESWTHGSSQQRQKWFKVGYETGDLKACDEVRSADSI